MKTILTTKNGSKNKSWIKNRIATGEVEIYEENDKNDYGYKKINPNEKTISMIKFYESSNNEIVGYLGTSYHYKLYINQIQSKPMATKKKAPSKAQLEARAKFTKMVKEKAAAKKKGLNAPAKPKRRKTTSARTLCRKVIDVPGINKRTGQLLKGWHYVNGKPAKVTAKKKPVAKKKPAAKKKVTSKRKKFLGIF